jgi:hypothetical protein
MKPQESQTGGRGSFRAIELLFSWLMAPDSLRFS